MVKIIGYIHICQIKGWERSFDMVYESLMESGLYEATEEIRIGIVNEKGKIIPDERLNNDKFNIVYVGKKEQFERPTILHMRENAEFEDCNYWYLHTKGIRHWGGAAEPYIINWINLLLYWNITKWKSAVEKLNTYDAYSCLLRLADNMFPRHYGGNFWWTKSSYLKKLPHYIKSEYIAPETYICSFLGAKLFNAYAHKYFNNYFLKIKPEEYNTLEVTENIAPYKDLIFNPYEPDMTPSHLKKNTLPVMPPPPPVPVKIELANTSFTSKEILPPATKPKKRFLFMKS